MLSILLHHVSSSFVLVDCTIDCLLMDYDRLWSRTGQIVDFPLMKCVSVSFCGLLGHPREGINEVERGVVELV